MGDTIIGARSAGTTALPGFKEEKPTVFAGLYPVNNADYDGFRSALEKLSLNDAR
ncbi:MAG: hypothetical protein CM1200mP39_29530 [Dehalococcoidia bacterium]|nr:MAG: hypothetical protein CM1200mP39_29530 [Dehalococcoidia bacterium]